MLRDLALVGLFDHDGDLDDDRGDRASNRVSVPYPARRLVVDDDGTPAAITAHLANLSEGGATLRVYGPVHVDMVAHLAIDIGRVQIDAPVRVAWTRTLPSGRTTGVTFDQLTSWDHSVIAQLIADRK